MLPIDSNSMPSIGTPSTKDSSSVLVMNVIDETDIGVQGITIENKVDVGDDEDENPFEKKKRNKATKVWNDFKEVTLLDGSLKVEYIYRKHCLGMMNSGAILDILRHTRGCL